MTGGRTVVRPAGEEHPRWMAVRESLVRAVEGLAAGSPLDTPAERRALPTAVAAYQSIRHGYYVDTATADEPAWREEAVRLTEVRAAPGGKRAAGTRTLEVEGTMENATGTRFAVAGTLFGDVTLHLTFDSLEPGVGGTAHRVTFAALFPYFHAYAGKSVWHGFWLGRDGLNHPQVKGFVLSSGPLKFSDLTAITDRVRIRSVPAGVVNGLGMPEGFDLEQLGA